MNRMTCREFDEVVHEFVRMELLDVNVREAALDHAAHCANCAQRMTEAAILAEAGEAASGSLRDQQTPPSVEAAVLAAFRNHHRRATWRRSLEWAAIGAAAAIVLVFLWNVAGPSNGRPTLSPRKDASSVEKGPQDARLTSLPQPAASGPAAETEVVNVGMDETLSAEDFVPLPFADALGPEDLGMVVRVQLTRASLRDLGYPVADTLNLDGDLISADVLVGEDGWPRAVRVVP